MQTNNKVVDDLIENLENNSSTHALSPTCAIDYIKTTIKSRAVPSRFLKDLVHRLTTPTLIITSNNEYIRKDINTVPLLFTLSVSTQRHLLMSLYQMNALSVKFVDQLIQLSTTAPTTIMNAKNNNSRCDHVYSSIFTLLTSFKSQMSEQEEEEEEHDTASNNFISTFFSSSQVNQSVLARLPDHVYCLKKPPTTTLTTTVQQDTETTTTTTGTNNNNNNTIATTITVATAPQMSPTLAINSTISAIAIRDDDHSFTRKRKRMEEEIRAEEDNDNSSSKRQKKVQDHEDNLQPAMTSTTTTMTSSHNHNKSLTESAAHALSPEMIQKLNKLRALLDNSNQSSSNQYPAMIAQEMQHSISQPQLSLDQLRLMLNHLNLHTIADQCTLVICKAYLVTNQVPHRHTCAFIHSCLLPKFLALNPERQAQQQKKASRQLFQSVQHVCTIDPEAIVEALLLPILSGQVLSAAQFEVMNRIVGTCLPHHATTKLVHQLMSDNTPSSSSVNIDNGSTASNGGDLVAHNWNDFVSTLLKNIFAQHKSKILGSNESESISFITNMLLRLEMVAPKFSSSAKFGALCSTIISQYGKLLIPHIDLMRSIVNSNETFMKKTMNASLDHLIGNNK